MGGQLGPSTDHVQTLKIGWNSGGGNPELSVRTIIKRHTHSLMAELREAGVVAPTIVSYKDDPEKPGDGLAWDAETFDPPDPPWATHV